jgi:hypothetical protein
MKGGEVPSQISHKVSCIMVQMRMLKLGILDTSNHLILLPGEVTLKSRTTVIVLANTMETVTVNTMTTFGEMWSAGGCR